MPLKKLKYDLILHLVWYDMHLVNWLPKDILWQLLLQSEKSLEKINTSFFTFYVNLFRPPGICQRIVKNSSKFKLTICLISPKISENMNSKMSNCSDFIWYIIFSIKCVLPLTSKYNFRDVLWLNTRLSQNIIKSHSSTLTFISWSVYHLLL